MPSHDAGERWLHDLRNAVNTVVVSVHVSRRLLEKGETESALGFLVDVQSACDRCKTLLHQPPSTVGIPAIDRRVARVDPAR